MPYAVRNVHFRTSDGQRDYVFDFEYVAEGWRIYIMNRIDLRGASAVGLHVLGYPHRPYICWAGTIPTLDAAKSVAGLWADAMQGFYTTGVFAPPQDRTHIRDVSPSARWPLSNRPGDPQRVLGAREHGGSRPPRRWSWLRRGLT